MPRIDGERRQDREDALDECRRQLGARLLGDLAPPQHLDPRAGELALEVPGEDPGVASGKPGGTFGDQLELRRGVEAIRREEARCGELLAPKGRHANLVELVEVAGEDRQELDALEERKRGVLREGEHALVEVEPGQLPVQEACCPTCRDRSRARRTAGGWP